MMSINLTAIAILNIKATDYRFIISKREAINLMQNIYLTEKAEHYKKNFIKTKYQEQFLEL